MSTEDRVKTLRDRHAELDAELRAQHASRTSAEIAELKKAKLAIKDEITRLQEEMRALVR